MIQIIPKRWFNFAGFAFCAGVLGYAVILQYTQDLEPCPLCILQRVAFVTTGLFLLIAGLHNPGKVGTRIYGTLAGLASLTGAGIAGWHVWIQHLPPDQVPECGPGLDYMLEVFSLGETLEMVFTGSGECADIVWSFLGLSMPAWALLCFIGLAVGGLVRNWME